MAPPPRRDRATRGSLQGPQPHGVAAPGNSVDFRPAFRFGLSGALPATRLAGGRFATRRCDHAGYNGPRVLHRGHDKKLSPSSTAQAPPPLGPARGHRTGHRGDPSGALPRVVGDLRGDLGLASRAGHSRELGGGTCAARACSSWSGWRKPPRLGRALSAGACRWLSSCSW